MIALILLVACAALVGVPLLLVALLGGGID